MGLAGHELMGRQREPGDDDEEPALQVLPSVVPGKTYLGDLHTMIGDDEPATRDAWLVEGLIGRGVPNIIAGAPKSWKSFLMLHMGICVAAGLPVFGRFKTKRSRVLIIEREDPEDEVVTRVWRIARGLGVDPRTLSDTLSINVALPFSFDDHEHVARMRRDLGAWRPGLVLMDSLRRMHTKDENSSKDMSSVFKIWADLCSEFACAVTVVHHNRKQSQHGGDDEADTGDQMRGSNDLRAFMRHMIGIRHKKKENISIATTEGNLKDGAEEFAFRLEDGLDDNGKKAVFFRFIDDVGKESNDAMDGRVLKALEAGPMSSRDLRNQVGGKGVDVDNSCKRLQRAGIIDRINNRTPWRLTPQQEFPT